MTTLLAESTGQLTVAIQDCRSERSLDELAFRSAAEVVESGERLIVVDTGHSFDPARMSQSARFGALEPANLMKQLHILRAASAGELEDVVSCRLESMFERFDTRHVLLIDPLNALYDPAIATRDAARILGKIKARLEELAETGAQIVVLCGSNGDDLGTRSHFLASLRSAANRVYLRSNT
jgi:hypothetical protein